MKEKVNPKVIKSEKGIDVIYSFTQEEIAERLKIDRWYDLKDRVMEKLTPIIADEYLKLKKDEIIKQISFEEIKSILMLQLGQELLEKMALMTKKNNY